MRPAAILALPFLAAGPALSLSCAPPDAATAFLWADEAEEAYVVVLGALELPEGRLAPEGRPDAAAGRISGRSLGADGRFAQPFESEVEVVADCAGPWCGAAAPGEGLVMFVERAPDGDRLTVGPCGGTVFEATGEVVETLAACMTDGACRPIWER